MLILLLVLLTVFWLLGYIAIPGVSLRKEIFSIRGRQITVWDVLTFLVILWIIGVLPGPFHAIAAILLVVWLLGIIGIIQVANFSAIVILTIIAILLLHIFR